MRLAQQVPIGSASGWDFCYNESMSRDRFKQAMFNPYFKSNYYNNESKPGQFENSFFNFLHKINIFRKKKNEDKA